MQPAVRYQRVQPQIVPNADHRTLSTSAVSYHERCCPHTTLIDSARLPAAGTADRHTAGTADRCAVDLRAAGTANRRAARTADRRAASNADRRATGTANRRAARTADRPAGTADHPTGTAKHPAVNARHRTAGIGFSPPLVGNAQLGQHYATQLLPLFTFAVARDVKDLHSIRQNFQQFRQR